MADLTFAQIVQRQLRLLAYLCERLTTRALAGTRADLDNLFVTQDRLEHWLQYHAPLADLEPPVYEAPAPLPGMRPAPPLPHEPEAAYDFADTEDSQMRPRVTFPPEPLWVEDLERGPVEEREG